MTACWSAGRYQKYPYYLCFTKGCEAYRKSVPRAKMESAFEALLSKLTPTKALFILTHEMFSDLWEKRAHVSQDQTATLKKEYDLIERKIEQFVDRIGDAQNMTLIQTYENKLKVLHDQKVVLREKIEHCGRILPDFDETFRTAFTFLSNPCDLWSSARLEDKRAVLKLVFAEKLSYHPAHGFRTAKTTLPFNMLEGFEGGENQMARPTGIEPVLSP